MKTVLLVVDIQNDFLPGGALAVKGGDEVVAIANRMIALKGELFDLVVATQDWHPAYHGSFAVCHPGKAVGEEIQLKGLAQILWPPHCVQGTAGADFAPNLRIRHFDRIFQKGVDPEIDSYSGFFDNGKLQATGLSAYLKAQQVGEIYIVGLSTDYFVKFTALDAQSEGFSVSVIEDGVRAVNLALEDAEKSLAEMKNAGIKMVKSSSLETGGLPKDTDKK